MRNFGFLKLTLIIGMLVVFGAGQGWSATLMVHPTEGDYNTIAAAINLADKGDEILVAPGTYEATELIVNQEVIIISEQGPELTTIISTGGNGVLFTSGGSGSVLSGFNINGNGSGIAIVSSCHNITIRNNILAGSTGAGISLYLASDATKGISGIIIENNTIVRNGMEGIIFNNHHAYNGHWNTIANCTVRNNIIYKNNGIGIRGVAAKTRELYYNYYFPGSTFYNNILSENASPSAIFTRVTKGDGNIFGNPTFVDENTSNYRLKSKSPCINVGVVSQIFNDPDGSRNDIGAYGGPGSAAFWSPVDVPVITEFLVTPSSVSQNGTITIKATGMVR